VKTYVPKEGEIEKKWFVIDADGQVLGRVAAEAAKLLRGKHKPQFTPFLDCGDHVIIVNAAKAKITGSKEINKKYYSHSRYMGGMSEITYSEMMRKHPTRAMLYAVKGMLPQNRLGRALATHVRIYAGAEHPHEAQSPKPHSITR